ncbi:glycosyltransferase family 87 protein [Streptomyces capillispiralis]|uniref:Arabinofuranan 3-O-arabinosyltransferase n=1 Tax=Streptomyces capillispiralis TaxID=68182 RepID=A0A561TF85_9ACTN|nr:glycosyltransferase family 87 protein [Streptomyces capillispiralis]TWF85778.1 arabinofuranan 3-O-arabinosyltransferase [Streptomyces capillispiralis]GHH89803.1 membrane protein [Streptomyces capillispiralis]
MTTGKSDISGWLVRPAGGHLWAGLAALLGALTVHTVLVTSGGGMDNAIVVDAARTWLAGGSPYDDPHFLYFPSAVVAAVPQALLPRSVLDILVPPAVTLALALGWACALRLHRVPLGSRLAALGLLGLAAGFAPFGQLVRLGNWTVTAVLALPLCLLLASRGRWVAAGLVVGVAVALKPLLAPMALLFCFARRWRALAVLVAVPSAASAGAALLLPDPTGFFTRTLPFLLHGDDAFVRLYEASPAAVLPRLGVPGAPAALLGLLAAAAGVVCAYRRWHGPGPVPQRLAETAAGLMLAAFLVSRPSYNHYLLVVLPLLLAGLPHAGAVARRPWFWLALVPQLPGVAWPWLEPARRRAFRDAFTLCALAVTVAHHCVRGTRGTRGAGEPEGTPGRARAAVESA